LAGVEARRRLDIPVRAAGGVVYCCPTACGPGLAAAGRLARTRLRTGPGETERGRSADDDVNGRLRQHEREGDEVHIRIYELGRVLDSGVRLVHFAPWHLRAWVGQFVMNAALGSCADSVGRDRSRRCGFRSAGSSTAAVQRTGSRGRVAGPDLRHGGGAAALAWARGAV